MTSIRLPLKAKEYLDIVRKVHMPTADEAVIPEAPQLEEKIDGMLEHELGAEVDTYIPETPDRTVVEAMENAISKQLDNMRVKLERETQVLAASVKRKADLELAIEAFTSALNVLTDKDTPKRNKLDVITNT